jgi:hypothetical protein
MDSPWARIGGITATTTKTAATKTTAAVFRNGKNNVAHVGASVKRWG